MRLKSKTIIKYGRRFLVLLLICGLFAPMIAQTDAASVVYQYNRITNTSGLPTDDKWHDYFIAWEDDEDSSKVWFTDFHWYTPDGDNNIDAGGITWMEYVAGSTLPTATSYSFTSSDPLGHMQIKYAGMDSDNNSPKYYIRVSTVTGGYSYFTRSEPVSKESQADAFTFEDQGDDFYIFVNVPNGTDKYLTRDGRQLETTLSSSASYSECEMRVYKRTYTIEEDDDDDDAVSDSVIGKVTMYEYNWLNEPWEVNRLAKANMDKGWVDVFMAWEDCDGGASNKNKVWYTKEVWYDGNKPNYSNSSAWDGEFYYWSNECLGDDGYSSPTADRFILSEKVGHFQIKFVGWDSDNRFAGIPDTDGKEMKSPVVKIRFEIAPNQYCYVGKQYFESEESKAAEYTLHMQTDAKKKDESHYYYNSFHVFQNISWGADLVITRKGNRMDLSSWAASKMWEFPFRFYNHEAREYDAIVKSFSVGAGATYSIDRDLILSDGVTITVEDGGVLMVDRQLYNNGNIIVKNGGTVIVNEGGYIMPYRSDGKGGTLRLDGGNMVILDGGKVLCDDGVATLEVLNGATVVNRGALVVGRTITVQNNSLIKNESTGMILLGGKIMKERGSMAEMSFDQMKSFMSNGIGSLLVAKNSHVINEGKFYKGFYAFWEVSDNSTADSINGGQITTR